MAVVFESVQTSNSGTTSVTVTKPASLAEGDLMVAHLGSSNAAGVTLDAHTSSGWTQIATAQSGSGSATNRGTALYKVATSGDVAASDFTFTCDADSESSAGAIFRFTGAAGVSNAVPDGSADADSSSTASHTFTNTLTPDLANSFMLFLATCANSGGTSFSNYAITTNNPTWTERYDIANAGATGDGDTTLAGATASRPEISATGDSTVSSGAVVSDSVGIIVAIYPIVSVTVNADPLTLTGTIPNASITGDANVTVTPLVATGTLPNATITTQENTLWTNESLPPETTWTLEEF